MAGTVGSARYNRAFAVLDVPFLTILGGGPGGLAAGFYARKLGLTSRILEGSDRTGGHCVTEERSGFRFDRGAHRFHDKDAEITAEIRALLGDELVRVSLGSAIYDSGRFLNFPPSPQQLLSHLGPAKFASAAAGALVARATMSREPEHFEGFARRAYGPDIARLFLLNYSEKLWGTQCDALSPRVSGGRLRGLRLSTLLQGNSNGNGSQHLDGSFYYPRGGYGRIVEKLAEACGPGTIRCASRVTRLSHDGRRITQVEVNGHERLPVDRVAATLPLGLTLKLLDPSPADHIVSLADSLRFRHVRLVAWFLSGPRVTEHATIYFPDSGVPFTRVYEPLHRSAEMSPPGHTSLVAEIPCDANDAAWTADDEYVVKMAQPTLEALGWVTPNTVVGTSVVRLSHAYPVLTVEAERAAAEIVRYLDRFENLHLLGRNGLFHYGWLHTVMRMAKNLTNEFDREPRLVHE